MKDLITTPMTKYIHKMFNNSFEKKWYETYWAIDLHGTVMIPSYDLNEKTIDFYPYAEEVLKLMTNRLDIKMIMFTSSYPQEIERYVSCLKTYDIEFDKINKNPDICSNNGNFGYYVEKFYFNVMFDDKAGFEPHIEWEALYKLFLHYNETGFLPDIKWTKKY